MISMKVSESVGSSVLSYFLRPHRLACQAPLSMEFSRKELQSQDIFKILIHCQIIFQKYFQLFSYQHCENDNFPEFSTMFKIAVGTSLEVQWLRLCTSTAEARGSIPGWRIKIPNAFRLKH